MEETKPEPIPNHGFGRLPDELRTDSEIVISPSALMEFIESPEHYARKYILKRSKETKAQLDGTLIHRAILEPETFAKTVMVMPIFEGYTAKGELTSNPNCKEVKEKKEAWINDMEKQAGGHIDFIDQELFDKIRYLQDKVFAHPKLKEVFKKGDGVNEVAAYWTCDVTGVRVSMRVDRLAFNGVICDIKTTYDASYRAFRRTVEQSNLHVQAAMNVDGFSKILGHQLTSFDWAVLQTTDPLPVVHYPLDTGSLEAGRAKYLHYLRKFVKCWKDNQWPGLPDQPMAISSYEFDHIERLTTQDLYDDET